MCPRPSPTSKIHANFLCAPKPSEHVSNKKSVSGPSTYDVQEPIFLCTLPDQWVPLGNSCSSSVDLPSSLIVSKSSSRSPSLPIPPPLRVLSSCILPLHRYRRLEETPFPPLNTPATKARRLEVVPTFEIDEFWLGVVRRSVVRSPILDLSTLWTLNDSDCLNRSWAVLIASISAIFEDGLGKG